MSFRRALFILIGLMLLGAVLVYALLRSSLPLPPFLEDLRPQLAGPWYFDFFIVLAAVAGSLLVVLAATNESLELFTRIFGRKPRDPADVPQWRIGSPEDRQARQDVLSILQHNVLQPRLHDRLDEMAHFTLRLQPRATYQQRPLPTDHRIGYLFRQSGRLLLILGEPGSGKTFTLLRLCSTLVPAEDDHDAPIPVMLDLATWAQKQLPLTDWITERMQREYRIGRQVTPAWLQSGRLALILDGLDELPEDERAALVRALNAHCVEVQQPVAVACRSSEYRQLADQLASFAEYAILPIEDTELERFLADPANDLAAVREAVKQDNALADLARTPLFLHLMSVAYRGLSVADLHPLLSESADRLAQHYDDFIPRIFAERRLSGVNYELPQALRRLRYLAQQLTTHEQTQFFFEDLQPDWLPLSWQFRIGLLLVVVTGVVSGLAAGMVSGMVGGLVGMGGGMVTGLVIGLVGGLLLGMVIEMFRGPVYLMFVGLFVGLFAGFEARPSAPRTRLNDGIRRSGRTGLVVGLPAGLAFGLFGGLLAGPATGLAFGLFVWLLVGLASGLLTVIAHYSLRLLLHRLNLLPFRLAPFLDQMARRLLVVFAGSHYRFLHITLQQHIAGLSDDDIARLAQRERELRSSTFAKS